MTDTTPSLNNELGRLVCRQYCRNQATSIKEIRHGCSMVSFDTFGQAHFRNMDAPSGFLTYSVALYHLDGRKLSEAEISGVQREISNTLDRHGVTHSIACIESHYDYLVEHAKKSTERERAHPNTDANHLDALARDRARKRDSGLSQISFRIPVTEGDAANYERLLAAMTEINEVAPQRSFPYQASGR